MKKNVLLSALLLYIFTLSAKNNSTELVFDNYIARPGVTVLIVDNYNVSFTSAGFIGTKYNYNDIYDKSHEYSKITRSTTNLSDWLKEEDIGRAIISYIFNRKNDGQMNDSIIRKRGLYASTSVQAMEADATILGRSVMLQDFGYEMLNNNYVLFILKNNDGFVRDEAILYHLNLPDDFLNENGLSRAWILPSDDDFIKKQKNDYYNSIKYEFKEIAKVKADDLVLLEGEDIYDKIMRKLENKVPEFAPQTPVFTTNPIKARIGTKENLKKLSRYDSYKYVARKGGVKSVKTATLRTTNVAANKKDNTRLSEFTQIAGSGVEAGYILKQRRDIRSSFTSTYQTGSMDGYGFSYDVLMKMSRRGASTYAGVYLYYSSYDITSMANGEYDYILNNPELFNSGDWSGINVGYRGANTWRVAKYFEPGVAYNIGIDVINLGDNGDSYDSDFKKSMVTVTPEAMLKINIAYPIHLYIGA